MSLQCLCCGEAILASHKPSRPRKYCSLACSHAARRTGKKQTKEEKAAYDRDRRAKLGEALKAHKRQRYRETMTPEKRAKEKAAREMNRARHAAYCRTPEYKAWKARYDKERRFAEYGPMAEAAMLLEDLEREIRRQATAYEVKVQQGYYTRNAQKRRRELWQAMRRN